MKKQAIVAFLRDAVIIATGVLGMSIFLTEIASKSIFAIFVAACVISLLNAFVRPALIKIAVPFVVAIALKSGGIFDLRAMFGKIALTIIGGILALWFINGFIFWLAFAGTIHFGTALIGSAGTCLLTILICSFFGIKRDNFLEQILRAGTRSRDDDDDNDNDYDRNQQNFGNSRERNARGNAKNSDDDVIDI